jgi:hypothetical protein
VAQAKCPSRVRTSLCCAASNGVADRKGRPLHTEEAYRQSPMPLLRWLELGFGGVGVDGV